MKTINIGGVPEHFNLAWYLTLKNGEYKSNGINLRWKDYYGGTGDMCQALRNKDVDLAVILTEGIIKDIVEGNPSSIIQTFVETPLLWGIHVASHSRFHQVDELKGTKAAISRYGSGSHLMAYINAENNQWDIQNDLQFEVIDNLNGAIEGLTNETADYFMWEKFTTKPIVDQGVFRRIGQCPTPWPCFVIAVRNEFLEENKSDVQTILNIINNTTSEFKDIPSIDRMIANRYEQKIEDVREWLALTEWSQSVIDKKTVENVQRKLKALNIIEDTLEYDKIVTNI
ncbi:substrate-binding domain-containing protein [Mangrovimonas sp. AS39]|uniref:substrate-binding domain-containing protein n=1 Tax=Mangrovimonas TaxID=1211036 RepID=UPI0006B43C19|nr:MULTISPECIES: substrate-binding domain-containing protein [Mangrovimonas]MCF1191768.1 substrate-binding domain-containing protein [Mangrovimonas futianensis]MCF1195344.1 substrate-binding domain-containing protein [Mangrovimonas futianensis]MCF1422048.1 substrate-binding domain-containing protein [Mangrovimonas futianensis]NIK91807.1 ABC transporter substrate-binding protein [Mangrovimonas sp. CR14]